MQHQHFQPQYPTRQQSQHYQSLDAQVYASHQQQQPQQQSAASQLGMTEEEYEEMEDRRRIQQQILRDKLSTAEHRQNSPDPNMTVKMTTNTGFALGAFDMSESLAIVEDLLDYFGDDDQNDEFQAERFNQAQLIEAERTHLQRESLVRHLYDSEEDYLRSLQDILSCYKRPMLLNAQHPDGGSSGASKMSSLLGGSASVSSKAVASRGEIETLFGNLEQLIEFHEGVRSMLEKRSKIWGPTQIMSDLLLSVIPKFKIYSRYFTNFHSALTVLDRISRTPQYKKFMEQCVIDNPPGTPSLHLMLAFPLKRLSIYRDLIQSICQATQPSHPDYHNLMRAQDLVNVIADDLRMERMIAQDQLALWDIQSNMVALPEPIMIPARRLLLRADLHKVDSALALEPRTYYLMNDVLIYARFDPKKNVYTFKGMFDLARTQINNPEDNATLPQLPNCIQIANAGRKQMMRCRSREERNYWMETMRRAVEVVNRSVDELSQQSGNGAPVTSTPHDMLPMRKYANSIASDNSNTNTNTNNLNSSNINSNMNSSTLNGSIRTGYSSKALTDNRSINSKSSTESTSSKPRKPNPQADFYGCSFGTSLDVPSNEDNYSSRSSPLAQTLSSNSSTSSVSTGSSSKNNQGLGAMLAAIPVEELTPKQAKAKAALAAAVEQRRQQRLKQEMKNGGAPKKSEMNRNVNLDFSSSFIPAKERIAKSQS
ncbi:hypothetical protein BGZ59_008837 [Podila verticillata]|nr:hypothetical protein BGZ59_008837 [Podila verticillata]KFH71734.1 hypothetical protein MVEG_02029 [Podila verticillata NRRL 6337]